MSEILSLTFLIVSSAQSMGCQWGHPFLTDSSFHSYCMLLALHQCWHTFLRVCTGLTKFNRDKIVQETEALLAEAGDIRRFIQQAVDHWPHFLIVHFTHNSTEGNINGQQIHAFWTSFYERITERNHTDSPSSPVVLRWLREQHEGTTIPVAAQPCGGMQRHFKQHRALWTAPGILETKLPEKEVNRMSMIHNWGNLFHCLKCWLYATDSACLG